jgi:hypothetical protein
VKWTSLTDLEVQGEFQAIEGVVDFVPQKKAGRYAEHRRRVSDREDGLVYLDARIVGR